MRTLETINNHALNKSKTKEAHMFSKSPRFSRVKDLNNSRLYDLSKPTSQIKSKSPSPAFPKERRFKDWDDLINYRKTIPSPNHYTSFEYFQLSAKKNKGISFPRSPKKERQVENVPGPGTYGISNYNPEHEKVYTISKSKYQNENNFNNFVGPGKYDIPLAQVKTGIVIGKEKRFLDLKIDETPSPMHYDRTLSPKNEPPKFSFSKSPRVTDLNTKRDKIPGPGEYNADFSEFSERTRRIINILNRL